MSLNEFKISIVTLPVRMFKSSCFAGAGFDFEEFSCQKCAHLGRYSWRPTKTLDHLHPNFQKNLSDQQALWPDRLSVDHSKQE